MPRITIEEKVKVLDGIYKIQNATYELPDQIFYKHQLMTYDGYHKEYTSIGGAVRVKAETYLKECLLAKQTEMIR